MRMTPGLRWRRCRRGVIGRSDIANYTAPAGGPPSLPIALIDGDDVMPPPRPAARYPSVTLQRDYVTLRDVT